MKKNKRIFIAVMSILIISAILIGVYFINKKPEKFNLTSYEKYSNLDELVKNGIMGPNGEYVAPSVKSADYIKNFYIEKLRAKPILKGKLKALKTGFIRGPLTPRITKDQLAKARADQQTWSYVEGLANAEGALVAGTLSAVWNFLKNDDVSGKAFGNLGLQIGIGLLSVGLAMVGLGALGSVLSGMFGGDSGPPPIDYGLIKKIVVEALKDSTLSNSMDLINTNIQNAVNDADSYNTMKYNLYTTCLTGYSNSQNIECITKPNPNQDKLFLDLNIVNTSGDIEIIHKRTKLSKWLEKSKINEVIKGQYGKQFILQASSRSAKSAVALYPLLNIIIGMTLTYYQELMLVDTVLDSNGNFKNPWLNPLIGDSRSIGSKQPSGTLLGEMQNICTEVFDYIKKTFKLFNDSLRFYTSSKKVVIRAKATYYWCQDQENIIPDEFLEKYTSVYGTGTIASDTTGYYGINVRDKEIMYPEGNTDRPKIQFANILDDYLNYPHTKLQSLKVISGIKWLVGEEHFSILEYAIGAPQPPNLNTQIIYHENGGYPFGSSAPSYEEALNSINNPKNYDNIEQTNKFKTFCSPDIFIENSSLNSSTCLNFNPNVNKVDASIFNNIQGQNKEYTDNMICEDLYADTIKSCLKPGISPGKQGEATPNSRYTYCYNSRTGKTSELLKNNGVLKCNNSEALYDLSSYISNKQLTPFSILSLNNFDLSTISDNGSSIDSKITVKDNLYTLNSKTTIFSSNEFCKDLDPNCKNFANNGECSKNPIYMLNTCKFSCGACEEKDIILRLEWELYKNQENIDIDSFVMKIFPSCLMRLRGNTSYSANFQDYYPRIPTNNPIIFRSNELISELTGIISSNIIESNIIIDNYEYNSFVTAKINISYNPNLLKKYNFIITSTSFIKGEDDYLIVKINGVKIIDNYEVEEFYLRGQITPGFDKLSFWIKNKRVDCIRESRGTTMPPTV